MDRLPALITVVALVAACDDAPRGAPASRVNGAKVAAPQGVTTEAFCDVYATPERAKPLAWPALGSGAPPVPASTRWRWINVWATWCKPCVEEMPRLIGWRERLGVDLTFVSVDESDELVERYRRTHPGAPTSLRVKDAAAHEAWTQALGLPGSPPIPIHVFVDEDGRVRCVRAGSVLETDYPVIERLLRE